MTNKNTNTQEQLAPPNRFKQKMGRLAAVAALTASSFAAGTLVRGSDSVPEAPSSLPMPKLEATTVPTTSPELAKATALIEKQQQQLQDMQKDVQRVTQIIANQAGVSIEAVTGDLPGPEKLPFFGTEVSPDARKEFEATTLKMGKRLKGTEGPWTEVCTANKVSFEGQSYVLTAAHCISSDISLAGIKGGGPTALDITAASSFDYALLDTNIPSTERTNDPLATVSRVSFSLTTDLALFSVNDTPSFQEMPALRLSEDMLASKPGQEVALRSLPGSSGNEPITDTGTYLGYVTSDQVYGGLSFAYDIVGLSGVDAETVDTCSYGASGSSAMTAEGVPLIGLSVRIPMSTYNNGTTNSGDPEHFDSTLQMKYADALHTDLSGFDVLCAYSRPQLGDITALVNPQDVTPFLYDPSQTGEGMK